MKKFAVISVLIIMSISLQAQIRQGYFKPAVLIDNGSIDDGSSEIQSSDVDLREQTPPLEENLSNSKPPSEYSPLWADDLFVTNQCQVSSSYTKLAFDYDHNGYVYLMLLADHGTTDTIWTYRSTDMGYTWARG